MTSLPRPIAVVGTTSSGKSTLCNLLCSSFLLPSGVQETTTHIVDVYHDPACATPMLVVADIDYSLAIERPMLDETEARVELARLMARPGATKHVCLRLSLNIIHTGTHPPQGADLIGLPLCYSIPLGAGCFIRDFPGVQHVGDSERIVLLEKFLDPQSIVILVFNAEETDHTKEERLLRVIFQAMSEKQMCPDSVLFVLNRKDAFERDRDPERSLNKRLDKIYVLIKTLMPSYWNMPPPEGTIIACSAGQMFNAEMVCWCRHLLVASERKHVERQFIYAVERLIDAGKEPHFNIRSWHPEVVWAGYWAIRRRSGIDNLLGQLRAKIGN